MRGKTNDGTVDAAAVEWAVNSEETSPGVNDICPFNTHQNLPVRADRKGRSGRCNSVDTTCGLPLIFVRCSHFVLVRKPFYRNTREYSSVGTTPSFARPYSQVPSRLLVGRWISGMSSRVSWDVPSLPPEFVSNSTYIQLTTMELLRRRL